MDEITKEQKSYLRMYLYELRKKSRLSLYQVTKKLDVSKPYYYQIEQGIKGHKMDVVLLHDLSVVLNCCFLSLCKSELAYQLMRKKLGIRVDVRVVIGDE